MLLQLQRAERLLQIPVMAVSDTHKNGIAVCKKAEAGGAGGNLL